MNNGLKGWPQGLILSPKLWGWPPQRREFLLRPELVESDILGTTDNSAAATNLVVNTPTNLAVGDLFFVVLKTTSNATPANPGAGWTNLQAGAQGSLGNITSYKIADGSEGASVTFTTSVACSYSALAFRVTNGGTPVWSTANTGSGATPVITGVSFTTVGGQMPCLALFCGTFSGAFTLANFPTTAIFTTVSKATTWTTYYDNVNSAGSRASLAFADINGTVIAGYQGVGTWTNFTVNNILIPPQRRPAAIYR